MEPPPGPDEPSPPADQEQPPAGVPPEGSSLGSWELPDNLDFLRNRLLLAGLGVLAILLVTAIVLVVLGGATDDGADGSTSVQATPEGTVQPTPGEDITGRLLTPATMRVGPGLQYAIMGTVPEGAVIVVVGRNEDNTWLQVVYPPGSQLRGWVPANQLELTGDVNLLVVAGPAAGPDVEVPTYVEPVEPWTATPVPFTAVPQQPTRTPRPQTPTAALATATPRGPTNTPAAPTHTPPGNGQGGPR